MYAQFPKDLNLLALGYLPVEDVLPMEKNASWDSLASQSLDQRMQEIIQKWKASASDPSQRLETLREIFIVNPILSTLDEERQNRVLSSIEATSEEISTIFSEIYPWMDRAFYELNPHYYQFRFIDKMMPTNVIALRDNPKISLVRILAWKTFLQGKESFLINPRVDFLHIPHVHVFIDTSLDQREIEWLSRGAQIANLPLLEIEGVTLSGQSRKILKERIKLVKLKEIIGAKKIIFYWGIVLILIINIRFLAYFLFNINFSLYESLIVLPLVFPLFALPTYLRL